MTILELLETHSIAAFVGCDTLCTCDRKWRTNIAWRAHVAEVLEAHQREQQARAWSDGFHKGRKTENGSHVTTWPRNPYRAEQVRATP